MHQYSVAEDTDNRPNRVVRFRDCNLAFQSMYATETLTHSNQKLASVFSYTNWNAPCEERGYSEHKQMSVRYFSQ